MLRTEFQTFHSWFGVENRCVYHEKKRDQTLFIVLQMFEDKKIFFFVLREKEILFHLNV